LSPESVLPAATKESAHQGARKHVFDIQFVPTEFSAKGDGVANLLDEFRSMGSLEIVNQPEAEMLNVGYWQVRLVTELTQNDFSDQIDFIAENGAWRVVEDLSASNDGDVAFGIFGDSPGAPEENQGYGFFAPLPDPVMESGDGYGFFEPLSVPGGSESKGTAANQDGDGYGFCVAGNEGDGRSNRRGRGWVWFFRPTAYGARYGRFGKSRFSPYGRTKCYSSHAVCSRQAAGVSCKIGKILGCSECCCRFVDSCQHRES
jgi:hypothetical protein